VNDAGGREIRPGEIVSVRISDAYEYDLVGAIV
jgi:tRNA A37 methylthiotransferase MiaB